LTLKTNQLQTIKQEKQPKNKTNESAVVLFLVTKRQRH